MVKIHDRNYVDFVGQILGKLFQAIGILIFCLYKKHEKVHPAPIVEFSILISCNFLMTTVTLLPPLRSFCSILGLFMNISIGILYALYVAFIIKIVPNGHYSLSFGLGIGISCIFSYILYAFDKDYSFMTSSRCLYFYGIVGYAVIMFLLKNQSFINHCSLELDSAVSNKMASTPSSNTDMLLMATLLSLISITYAMGYFVPSGDISDFQISVELMRLVYFSSLVIAGLCNDKSKKAGLILSIMALAFAFSMPLMRAFPTGIYITWIISYFTGGFITVYRASFFIDVANEKSALYLAPLGIFIGRFSEPFGMMLRLWLSENNALLLFVISTLFSTTLLFFVIIFTKTHSIQENTINSPALIDYHSLFLTNYELSNREIQILDEILEHKSNKEIAATLFITEATVKFHVKNLLKKTECKNRNELINLYNSTIISQ